MMKKKCLLVFSLLLFACSNDDDSSITKSDTISDNMGESLRKEFEISSDSSLNEKAKAEHPVIQLKMVESCFGKYDSDSAILKVDTIPVYKLEDESYSFRVLGNTQCPPAEEPDYMKYFYKMDTLVIDIDKKDREFDVTCTCFFWSEISVVGDIDFSKVMINNRVSELVKVE